VYASGFLGARLCQVFEQCRWHSTSLWLQSLPLALRSVSVLSNLKAPFMQRLFVISISLVLWGVTTDLAALAQEAQVVASRRIVARATPIYPDLARRINLEGTVKLRVKVAPNGSVKSVEAVGGNPVLVKAAEDSIYKFRWIPAQEESVELVEMKFQGH